jgi:hypothetical protein
MRYRTIVIFGSAENYEQVDPLTHNEFKNMSYEYGKDNTCKTELKF